MKITLARSLIIINILAWLTALAIYAFPSPLLRIVLGVPYLLFFPGFALMAAVAPNRQGPGTTERLVLSLALSLVVVPILGLILNYTPYGIRLYPVLYSVGFFVLLASAAGWLRQLKLPPAERAALEFHLPLAERAGGTLDNVFAGIMILVMTGALVTGAYYFTAPKKGEAFTQFYLLEQAGKYYPDELRLGQGGTVRVGITNREGREASYRVRVLLNGKIHTEVGPLLLPDGERWQGEAAVVPATTGQDQEIELLLFRGNEPEPCLKPLYLWVDVTAAESDNTG